MERSLRYKNQFRRQTKENPEKLFNARTISFPGMLLSKNKGYHAEPMDP